MRMWGYKSPLKFLFYLLSRLKKSIRLSWPWFFDVSQQKELYNCVHVITNDTAMLWNHWLLQLNYRWQLI